MALQAKVEGAKLKVEVQHKERAAFTTKGGRDVPAGDWWQVAIWLPGSRARTLRISSRSAVGLWGEVLSGENQARIRKAIADLVPRLKESQDNDEEEAGEKISF